MIESIKMDTPCELIDVTPLNPLISKCLIKVCYVGPEPNRNKSVITKDVAIKIANSLPGSPIVGFYNEAEQDFEEHNTIIEIKDGHLNFKNETVPYGFVDLNARVWFQDYIENDKIRTYLMTEGYLWTGQYPEAQRVIDKGNNQSMEFDLDSLEGSWSIDDKTGMSFFIVNDAIFANLCILGEKYEPCFEGASITSFSLNDDFNVRIYNLMKEVQKLKGGNLTVEMNKFGASAETEEEVKTPEEDVETKDEEEVIEDEPTENPVEEDAPETEEAEEDAAESTDEPAAEEEEEAEEESADAEDESAEESVEEPAEDENQEIEDNPTQFTLDDFQDLQRSYSSLEEKFNQLQSNYNEMKVAYESLVEFKNTKEREQKEAMIDSFYMLNDSDKEDVVKNIDKYSVEEIEAKLSVICVHQKLDLSSLNDETKKPGTTFNLDEVDDDSESNIPALVSVLRKNRHNEN